MSREAKAPSNTSSESPMGFRFAVLSALIRNEGYSLTEAEDTFRIWQRYARYAMLSQKSPASTATHLARFQRYQRDASPTSHASHGRSAEEVHPALADKTIADDLRIHADAIHDEDPDHARELYHVSDWIEFSPDASWRDPAQVAARALLRQGPRPTRSPRSPRCDHGTEIVSLIFPSDFSPSDVVQWTRAHGFLSKNLEFSASTRSTRAPQQPTSAFETGSFRTILLSEAENIRAVIGCPRTHSKPGRKSPR